VSLRIAFVAVTLSVTASAASYAADYEQSIQCAGFFELAISMQPDAGNAPGLKQAWIDYAESLNTDANVAADTSAHAAKMQSDFMVMKGDPAQMGPYMAPYQTTCPNPPKPVERADPGLCFALADRASLTVTLNVVAAGDPLKRGGFTKQDMDNLAISKAVRAISEPVEAKFKGAETDFDDIMAAQKLIPGDEVPEEALDVLKTCLAD
jgi:hypothetical protein